MPQPTSAKHYSINLLKDMCAFDSNCTAISEKHAFFGSFKDCADQGSFCAVPDDRTLARPPTITNTSYDMFLGIKGEPKTAPSAFCTVESGGGNSPDVKWLRCGYDFKFGGHPGMEPSIIKNHYDSPPQTIYKACLDEPECVGFRLKNDGSGGDLLKAYQYVPSNITNHGLFKMP